MGIFTTKINNFHCKLVCDNSKIDKKLILLLYNTLNKIIQIPLNNNFCMLYDKKNNYIKTYSIFEILDFINIYNFINCNTINKSIMPYLYKLKQYHLKKIFILLCIS